MSEKQGNRYASSIKRRLTACYVKLIVAAILLIIALLVSGYIYIFQVQRDLIIN